MFLIASTLIVDKRATNVLVKLALFFFGDVKDVMGATEIDRQSTRPVTRDLRGILVGFLAALAIWAFLIIGVLGLVLKILH
jgi:hypothetical protein